METGTVKWYNPDKGYGFISRAGQDDVFVHATNITAGPLTDGAAVSFEVQQGRKGLEATNVTLAP